MTAKPEVALLTLERRRVPRLAEFDLTFLSIEVRRLARNRRTVVLTHGAPVRTEEQEQDDRRDTRRT